MKPSPLNEWQATSLGVGSRVTQQLFGNRRLVTCAGFRDVASLKTKATFKSKPVYLGQWYSRDNPRDIGDGRQAAGTRGSGSEPGCAKRDGPSVCTRPCPEKWVHGSFLGSERWVYRSFLCSRLWSLPSCTQRALILQHYMRQSSLGPGHIAGILGSMMGAGGLVHQLTQVHSTLGTSDCLYRRKLHPISREKKI